MRLVGLFASIILASLLTVTPHEAATLHLVTPAEKRVALVIGNGAYRNAVALPNPRNDAGDVAVSLRALGFDVTELKDASFDSMRRRLIEFGRAARGADIAAVFFAGHGMEMGGENWLIPVDAALRADADVEQEAISLKSVTNSVSGAAKLGLVILDACRDNPFAARMQRTLRTRSMARGLARIEPVGSVLVAYAAKDGTTAADGAGRNSPFTSALLRHIETPGLEINFLFRNVRDDVMAATDKQQEPFVYGSLSKEAIFLASLPSGGGGPQSMLPLPPAAPAIAAADELTWSLIRDTADVDTLRRFIRQFPDSPRRAEAERRIDQLANLPAESPRPAAPAVAAPPPAAVPPAAPPPRPAAAKPTVQESHAHTPARPAHKGGNCFAFNGRQVCE